MITTEQTRETVNRLGSSVEFARQSSIANLSTLVDQLLDAHRQISHFVAENRRYLSKGSINPKGFGEGEELGRSFKRQWLANGRTVLPMLEAFPEVSESNSALALLRLMHDVDQELREIDFHQRSMNAYLEKHPMPKASVTRHSDVCIKVVLTEAFESSTTSSAWADRFLIERSNA